MRTTLLITALAIGDLLPAVEPVARLSFDAPPGRPIVVEMKDAPITVIFFLSALCPMSGDYSERIVDLERRFAPQGARLILVNANAHESDSMVEQHRRNSALTLPVWRDRQARAAARLEAHATPTVVVLDRQGAVRYWGSIDDSRSPARVRRRYLEDALQALLAGQSPALPRTKVMGCAIKAE